MAATAPCARAMGIGLRTTPTGRRRWPLPSPTRSRTRIVSTEIHRSGGPLTLVPLPDHEGRPSSAIFWMERRAGDKAPRRAPRRRVQAEMTERWAHPFGPLKLASRRTVVADHRARSPIGLEECARGPLVAEAAPCRPPIGAQGAEHEPGRHARAAGPGRGASRRSGHAGSAAKISSRPPCRGLGKGHGGGRAQPWRRWPRRRVCATLRLRALNAIYSGGPRAPRDDAGGAGGHGLEAQGKTLSTTACNRASAARARRKACRDRKGRSGMS